MASVLVCDDHSATLRRLRAAVATVPGVDRVATASSGEEVLARFSAERPDLVLVDVGMPGLGGVETLRRLLATHPDARVVLLATAGDHDGIARGIAGGALGYVHKDTGAEAFGTAAAVAAALSLGMARPRRRRPVTADLPALTPRELDVLAGMAEGKSNGEIARELFLADNTVKTHARRLFRKLGVRDRAGAVAFGFRLGLVR